MLSIEQTMPFNHQQLILVQRRFHKRKWVSRIKQVKKSVLISLTVVVFIAFWELLSQGGLLNPIYLSSPKFVLKDLVEFWRSGELVRNASITLKEALLGLFFGTISGVGVAVLLHKMTTIGQVFEPIITALNSIPQIALSPLYIIWFGIGLTSKVVMASLMVFFLVFFATFSGMKNLDEKLAESAALLGAKDWQILVSVTLPSCLPWILSGVKSGIGAALIGSIVGEYLGSSAGIGWMISYATSYYNITRVMSCLVVLLVIGAVFNGVLSGAEKRLLKYKQ